MNVPPIDWATFSWEAFATLATGCLAVGGAFWIGRRQTEILARQAEIEVVKTRIELFERRMEIVELHSKLAGQNYNDETRRPFIARFMDMRGSVPFLFDDAVAKLFDAGYEIGIDIDIPAAGEAAQTRKAASENRAAFLRAVEPYMRLGTRP